MDVTRMRGGHREKLKPSRKGERYKKKEKTGQLAGECDINATKRKKFTRRTLKRKTESKANAEGRSGT